MALYEYNHNLARRYPCKSCAGSGWQTAPPGRTCPIGHPCRTCNGRGYDRAAAERDNFWGQNERAE